METLADGALLFFPLSNSILPYILSLSPNHIRGGGSPTGPLAGPVALVTVFVFVLSHSQVAGWSAYSTAKFPSSKLSSTNKNRTMWLIENRELTEMIKASRITLTCTI